MTRSTVVVTKRAMNELALFAGGGGSILAGSILGFRTVCAVEIDPGKRAILLDRQRDGTLPPFPIWDDIRTFDPEPWRGIVQVVAGGFPCQDISLCKRGAKGITGERSGLWSEMARIVRHLQPRLTIVENTPVLTSRGLGRVLGDLAEMGMDARWGVFSAAVLGCAHYRHRIFLVAYPNGTVPEGLDRPKPVCIDPQESRRRQSARAIDAALPADDYARMPRDPDVLARGMDGLEATGAGWVPKVAARAVSVLSGVE